MNRLLKVATSRWMYVAGLVLACAAAHTQSHALLVALYIFTGVVVGAILIASIPTFHKLNNAWRKYPNTPEAKEYEARKGAEIEKNSRNKIEI